MSAAPARMNPFPGLRPFTPEEDYLFFGREEQTLELLERLAGNRFLAVVGTSGSGKSSLVRCGLLSQLLGGNMLVAGASWEIAVTHPGGNPLGRLTEALLDAGLYNREEEQARENLLATLIGPSMTRLYCSRVRRGIKNSPRLILSARPSN